MNGKQVFCFSLIILSISMGLNWFKNKPKVKAKKQVRPRAALNFDDMQIRDNQEKNPDEENLPDNANEEDPPENNADEDDTDDNPEAVASETSAIASGTTLASGTGSIDPELNDPVILAFKNLRRNPFEESPYAKLIEELRALSQVPEEEAVVKETRVLKANFNAIINTESALYAVIDSDIYRKGDPYDKDEEKIITDINEEMIFIETPSVLYLIPKVGVNVKVASDGSYTYADSAKN